MGVGAITGLVIALAMFIGYLIGRADGRQLERQEHGCGPHQ